MSTSPDTASSALSSSPTSEEAKSWHTYRRTNEQETPKRLEEAAKFLTGLASIALTLFLQPKEQLLTQGGMVAKVAVAFWLLSLLPAFWVIFPRRYRYAEVSAEAITQLHRRVVLWKYGALVASAGLFWLGLALLTWCYFSATPVTLPGSESPLGG